MVFDLHTVPLSEYRTVVICLHARPPQCARIGDQPPPLQDPRALHPAPLLIRRAAGSTLESAGHGALDDHMGLHTPLARIQGKGYQPPWRNHAIAWRHERVHDPAQPSPSSAHWLREIHSMTDSSLLADVPLGMLHVSCNLHDIRIKGNISSSKF